MTLEAKFVAFGPHQLFMIAAVRLVTGAATLLKCRLVVYGLFFQVRDIAVAAQANLHGIRLGQANVSAGVWIVTIGAIPRCAWMLHLGAFDGLGLFVVAHHAQRFCIRLGEHHFSVLRRCVADFALLVRKRRVCVLGHKLRLCRLVRIMALDAVRCSKRLVLVCLL